jgi:hypothetical protein
MNIRGKCMIVPDESFEVVSIINSRSAIGREIRVI